MQKTIRSIAPKSGYSIVQYSVMTSPGQIWSRLRNPFVHAKLRSQQTSTSEVEGVEQDKHEEGSAHRAE